MSRVGSWLSKKSAECLHFIEFSDYILLQFSDAVRYRSIPQTYKSAGVDIDAAEEFLGRVKREVRTTFSKEVLSDIGAFGGFYDARFRSYKQPVLVSSIDGVGTKLKVAAMMGRHSSVGEDLVNHCVNDILVCGARPLFFLDYIAVGKLSPRMTSDILRGIVKACKENHCALIGGETAEMPGVYREGEYDLVGAIVGVAERGELLDGRKVRQGDQLIALPSTGLHTNGYSLARKVLFRRFHVDDFVKELGAKLGDALLRVHRSYLKPISSLSKSVNIHAMAHITGGGIAANTKRVVPRRMRLKIDWDAWERPAIFRMIQEIGNIPESNMRQTFNLGVGLVIIVGKQETEKALRKLKRLGEQPFVIGHVK